MDGRNMRSLVAAGVLALGLAGLGAGLLGGTAEVAQSQSNETYDVWITSNGFNPASCTVRRGDNVRWINKDSVVRNVTFNNLTLPQDPNTPLSTGDLQPGQTSFTLSFDFIGTNGYHEKYMPSFVGNVSTTDGGVPSCTQQPPTPTPTSTPTITPVPPTPTPTAARPAGCGVQPGCAVVPAVARDEEE